MNKALSIIAAIVMLATTSCWQQKGKNDKLGTLETEISIGKSQLPLQIDQFTMLTGLEVNGDYVYYIYEVEDTTGLVMGIAANPDIIKRPILESLERGEDPGAFSLYAENGKGVVNHYHDSRTGLVAEVTITPQELQQATGR